MDIVKTAGKNIRTLREQNGFTQEDMAYQCGISLSTYSRIERGERNCRLRTLSMIAEHLQVPPCHLIAEKNADCRGEGDDLPGNTEEE